MVELPKPRAPRVERHVIPAYSHSEEGLGWAVSYADVLMVLLSFFVIFFSMSPAETEGILQKILVAQNGFTDLKNSDSGQAGSGGLTSNGQANAIVATAETQDIKRNIANLGSPLPQIIQLSTNFQAEKKILEDSLVLLLPDNIFASGKLDLADHGRQSLVEILEKMLPFKDDVELSFIGFSDSQKITRSKSKAVETNFDLSTLRAARALRYAVSMGYPPQNLTASGESHYGRTSRTLTLVVRARGSK